MTKQTSIKEKDNQWTKEFNRLELGLWTYYMNQ